MRKAFIIFITVLALCGLAAAASGELARVTEPPTETLYIAAGFKYALLDDGTAEITEYIGTESTVVMPKALDGHTVSAVRRNPFLKMPYGDDSVSGNRDVTVMVELDHPCLATIGGVLFNKITREILYYPKGGTDTVYEIPNGIRSIAMGAFYACENLSAVVIPDSVTRIGNRAFSFCRGLTDITIPDRVTCIEDWTFYGCKALTRAEIPGSVERIGAYCFSDCDALTDVIIPEGVISIGEYAFEGCKGLRTVTFPESLISIENAAFHVYSHGTYTYVPNRDIIFTVIAGSFAEQYCIDQGMQYCHEDSYDTTDAVFGDDDSWLD